MEALVAVPSARGGTINRWFHADPGGFTMAGYEAPAVTELGSVADFTREDKLAFNYDGYIFHKDVTS